MKEIIIHRNQFNKGIEIYDIFKEKLNLPEWFGKNPDALWDMLTCYVGPTKFIFIGFNKKEKNYEDEYELKFVFECLKDAAKEFPDEFFFEMIGE